jgi:integrase
VRWREPGTGRERWKVLRTEQLAERFLEERVREEGLVRDGYLTAKQVEVATGRTAMLVESLIEYNADREYRRVSTTEITNSTALIQLVLDRCRWVRVSDVDAVRLKGVMRKLAKDKSWSARTVNRYSECLRGLFNHMVQAGTLAESPCSVLDVLDDVKDRRRVSRALTVAESDALVDAALDPRRRLMYLLRLRTGLRVRETLRLEWADIDDGLIRLRADMTKNGKPDVLPISDDLADEIADYQQYSFQQGRIFPTAPDTRTWKRDLARAGVEYKVRGEQADPKCTRHTFESHLLRSGADPTITMLLMRHSPRGGMALTLGRYVDAAEILKRKHAAIVAMTKWQQQQRKAAKSEPA